MNKKKKIDLTFHALLFLLFFNLPFVAHPQEKPLRSEYKLNNHYDGRYTALFNRLRYEIPIFFRQNMIDASVRLGLNFEDGWIYPLTVQFVDSAPAGIENALAYVQLQGNSVGIDQSLNINLSLFERNEINFKKVLAHELVHAMVNDEMGAQSSALLPLWFHEGLAVYGGNQGEELFSQYLSAMDEQEALGILDGLENFHSGYDYLESWLAFNYIYEKKGGSSLRNFIQEVIKRKGDISSSLSYTCFESWEEFQKNVKDYSLEKFKEFYREKNRGLRR